MLFNNYATHYTYLSSLPFNKLYIYSINLLILLALCHINASTVTASLSSSTITTPNGGQQLSNTSNNCPSLCTCKYQSSIQHLRISCDKSTSVESNGQDTVNKLDFVIKQLTITNTIVDTPILSQISQIIIENKIYELNLHQTTIDPIDFLSSDIFRLSTGLRKLSFSAISSSRSKSFTIPNGVKIRHFSELKHLESISMEKSDAELSTLILKTLPTSVHHISLVKNSINYLDAEYFSDLIELRSLNLSHNEILSIPYGLSQHLQNLKIFDISHNSIEHLQEEVFVGFSSLLILNVSFNKIRYVDTEVFNPLEDVEMIDLSHNEVIQIFEPYFQKNKKLKILLMSDTWSWDSFIDQYKGSRSFTEMERLLASLSAVEVLDLSDNEMIIIPETLTHAPQLKRVSLRGNPWECTCQDRWVNDWIMTTNVSIVEHNSLSTIYCHSDEKEQQQPFASYMKDLNCTNTNINARTPMKYYGIVGKNTLLQCHTQRHNAPTITWITPSKRNIVSTEVDNNNTTKTFLVDSNFIVMEDGNLFIGNITIADFGLYLCIASYPDLNITHYVHLGMDTSIFLDVKLISILVGWLTSFCFLFTVLTVQVVRILFEKCGIDCMTNDGPSRTKRVKAFFESIEQNNTHQLDWLRDNYNMQAKRIKDNCVSQLERIRESYTSQTKNLSDIKYYGAQQLHTVRDQYYDQIRRVSTYSTQHLCKVRENYVFQRNRVSKFSSHQLLRLRETYKWQAQALNKILENLPKTLNFDTCRGMGGRTDSMYLDESGELRPLEVVIDSAAFDNALYCNGLSDKMEHVALLIPPHQMKRLGDTFHPRFILPQNIEATELVVVVTKKLTNDSTPGPSCSSAGTVNEDAIIEEDENIGDDDDKC